MLDVSTITVGQFQAQFFRDFAYLGTITYSPTQLYNTGTEVYYSATQLFYTALQDGLEGVAPNSDPAKWQKTSDSISNYVQDQDVTNAFAEATESFNPALFDTDSGTTMAFLYMAAHYLCNDLKASAQGISAPGALPVSARSVGSVSETYSVPEAYTKDPLLAMYTQSAYGMKYLAMVMPRLRGNVVGVFGGTNA